MGSGACAGKKNLTLEDMTLAPLFPPLQDHPGVGMLTEAIRQAMPGRG